MLVLVPIFFFSDSDSRFSQTVQKFDYFIGSADPVHLSPYVGTRRFPFFLKKNKFKFLNGWCFSVSHFSINTDIFGII